MKEETKPRFQMKTFTRRQVLKAIEKLAAKFERSVRCRPCQGNGELVECVLVDCWEVHCKAEEHLKKIKCRECSGLGYHCGPEERRLMAKYLPDPEQQLETMGDPR